MSRRVLTSPEKFNRVTDLGDRRTALCNYATIPPVFVYKIPLASIVKEYAKTNHQIR